MSRTRLLAPVLVIALLASGGCGKKGPLYRPDEGPPKKEEPQPSPSPQKPPTSEATPAE